MAFDVTYTRTEKLFHKIAFARPAVQLAAEDIESTAFGSAFKSVDAARPVFITSLPRAGTTMMLEVLHRLPEFACTTYRDMPFVMAPILWSKLSGPFRSKGEVRERAHGDGIEIGYDSPEAFEEVIWKAHWPGQYRDDGIRLWGPKDASDEATAFLRRHMQKIIALRRPGQAGARYLSKNNANIARLRLLPRMYPDAAILLVLRDPLEHALSIHRQHVNFAQMHGEDPFVARYMEDIGHYEFGTLHRPIRFDRFAELTEGRSPDGLDYWLGYWIAAFEEALAHRDAVTVANYEALCAGQAGAFAPLLDALGVTARDGIEAAAGALRAPKARAEESAFDPSLVARAREIHADLAA